MNERTSKPIALQEFSDGRGDGGVWLFRGGGSRDIGQRMLLCQTVEIRGGDHALRAAVLTEKYVALIYVDVVEFDGTHVRKFYEQMASRFESFIKSHGMEEEMRAKLQDGLSPTSAVMLATRIFYNYFSVEVLFGVKDHFGKDTEEVVREISRILRHGMLG